VTGRAVEYTRRLATSTTTPCAFPSAVQPTRSAIVLDAVKDTQDRQIVTIVQCAEALAHYVEELHARTAWTSSSRMPSVPKVAQFIDSLGPSPERENEFYERRSSE
jgi:hypothetical protein